MPSDAFNQVAPEWEPSSAIQDLVMERTISPEETDFSIGVKRMESYFPLAVQSVGQLALHALDEKTRLSSAKYIIAANLQLKKMDQEEKQSPIENFLQDVAAEANRLKEQGKVDAIPPSAEGQEFLRED